jgi:hypothetical protein
MFKPIAILLGAVLAAGSAFAHPIPATSPAPAEATRPDVDEAWPTFDDEATTGIASRADVRAQARGGALQPRGEQFDGGPASSVPSAAYRFRVRIDLDAARETGTWPVREYDDGGQHAAVEKRLKEKRRPRKEYPNVMGISFSEWLAAHP